MCTEHSNSCIQYRCDMDSAVRCVVPNRNMCVYEQPKSIVYSWYLHLIYYFYTLFAALQIIEDDAKQKKKKKHTFDRVTLKGKRNERTMNTSNNSHHAVDWINSGHRRIKKKCCFLSMWYQVMFCNNRLKISKYVTEMSEGPKESLVLSTNRYKCHGIA